MSNTTQVDGYAQLGGNHAGGLPVGFQYLGGFNTEVTWHRYDCGSIIIQHK